MERQEGHASPDTKVQQQGTRCSVCHNLSPESHRLAGDNGLEDAQSDFVDFMDLQLGCESCQLLRRIVECHTRLRPGEANPPNIQIGLYMVPGRPTMISLSGELFGDEDEEVDIVDESLMLYRAHGIQCPVLPSLGPLGTVAARSDSTACFQFVKEHLERCTSSHSACSQPTDAALPTRLIGLAGDKIELLEPSPAQRGRYAALSHCWGTHQPIKTTVENLDTMKRGIPWSSLSAVFRDAIRTCRTLGVDFLWIDSLCIIQNSTSDWEAESAKMCDYYGNAHVTISAGSSPDGTVPFLAERDAAWLPRTFHVADSLGGSHPVFVRKALLRDSDKLGTRAWVWQEQVLSQRIIHYASSGAIWACREECVAEDGWDETKHVTSHFTWDLTYDLWERNTALSPHSAWAQAVRNFSALQITYLSDRLPAIGGIAARFAERMEGRYLAGHWENDLLRSLCWGVEYDPSQPDLVAAPDEYLAPTWSWVSVTAHISPYDPQGFLPRAKVVGAECTQPGLNPFGRVSGGHVLLRGRLVSGELSNGEDHRNMSAYKVSVGGAGEHCEPTEHICVDYLLASDDARISRARGNACVLAAPLRVPVHFLLLGEAGKGPERRVYVLIMSRCTSNTESTGSYCRLGVVQFNHDNWFMDVGEATVRIE